MKIYFNGQKIEEPSPAIALGNFDGMHKGHISVINAAKESGLSFGALLFQIHTSSVLGKKIKIITPLYKKIKILKELGADFVYLVDFNEEFMNMSASEFAKYISSIGVKTVSVGYDYRCCKGAKTDAMALGRELSGYGIKIKVSQPVTENGKPIKSTLLRELFSNGRLSDANDMMSHVYSMRGKVVRGLQNGHLLGFPTANIEVSAEELVLKDGVYYCKSIIAGKRYLSMANIGKNPTFDAEKRTVEVHIIDYDGDLYDDYLDVEFYDYIRPDKKFESIEDLIAQLNKDKNEVLKRHKEEE